MKVFHLILVVIFMSSCGPQRMRCGMVKRCVEKTQKIKPLVKEKIVNT